MSAYRNAYVFSITRRRINICMEKYFVQVRVNGRTLRTAVFAESSLHARLVIEYQFGIGSVISPPTHATNEAEKYYPIEELATPQKPPNLQQAKLNALQSQKDIAAKKLKAERDRLKVAKAQDALVKARRSVSQN